MNIKDALKETGKAQLDSFREYQGDIYAYIGMPKNGEADTLLWSHSNCIVPWRYHGLDTWQPYHPEPKCPACIEADENDKSWEGAINPLAWGNIKTNKAGTGDHLRKYHCTCKEDR